MNCIFCQKKASDIILENDLSKAFYDSYPVNKGHILIVPKRWAESANDLLILNLPKL